MRYVKPIFVLVLVSTLGGWLGYRLGKPVDVVETSIISGSPSLNLERTRRSTEVAKPLPELRAEFVSMAEKDRGNRRLDNRELSDLVIEVLEQDPQVAVALVQEHFHGLKRAHAYYRIIEHWGRVDPEATLAFVAGLDKSEDASSNVHNATTGFLWEWAERDPKAALDAWLALPDPKLANESSIPYSAECLARSASKNPEMREVALKVLLDQPSSDARASAIAGVVATWAGRAPFRDITDWLAGQDLQGKEANVVAVQAATTAAQYGNLQAADWLLEQVYTNQDSPNDRANHLDGFAEEWARDDPDACATWLSTLAPSTETDWAIRGFLRRLHYIDPSTGFQWTREICNDDLRTRLTREMWTAWRRVEPVAAQAYVPHLTDEERDWLAKGIQ